LAQAQPRASDIVAEASRGLEKRTNVLRRSGDRAQWGELAKLFEPMAYQGAAQTIFDRIVGSLQLRPGKR
jgi:hypothetical protein